MEKYKKIILMIAIILCFSPVFLTFILCFLDYELSLFYYLNFVLYYLAIIAMNGVEIHITTTYEEE